MSSLEQQISCKLQGKTSAVESVCMSFTKSRSLWIVFFSEFSENVVKWVYLSVLKKRGISMFYQ